MKPIISKKQFGQLLLGWVVIMALLFLIDLAERGNYIHIIGLNFLLRPLLAVIFAAWLAVRHAKVETEINWRSVSACLLICVILLFVHIFVSNLRGTSFWLSAHFEHRYWNDMYAGSYFNSRSIHWEPRWLFYWFIQLCFLDAYAQIALAVELALYPIVKVVCVKRNRRRGTAASIAE